MLSLIVRYIKECYKRSIVIGICFFMSFLIIWTNGILKHTGNLVELNFLKEDSIYHLKFHNLNEKALASIKKSPDVDKIHIENLVDASKASSKYMINVIGKDKSQYKVLRGRYPNNNNEVMVQDWLLKNIGKDIGDNFEFESEISKGKVSYKIVGVLEDNVKEKSKLIFQFFTLNRKNQLDKYNLVNIILKDKGNIRSASKKMIKALKDKNLVKEGDYSINDMLIEAYENDGSTGLEVFKIIFMSVLFTTVIIASTYIDSIINKLGIGDKGNKFPDQLSGGEQQRVAIARAMVTKPMLLLADEPTGNLDSDTGMEILRLIRKIVDEEGQTVIMITHDEEVAKIADRVVYIRDGVVEV